MCTYILQKLGLLKTKQKNHYETKSNEILIVETANHILIVGTGESFRTQQHDRRKEPQTILTLVVASGRRMPAAVLVGATIFSTSTRSSNGFNLLAVSDILPGKMFT
jgi:hypothetical protein